MSPLRNHPAATHPDLIVGVAGADDAGVYRLSDGRALVQTVDFFTPVVDEAYDWGRIAAANALSDVYAMGATPLTALQLVGWPRDKLPFELAEEVVRGGAAVMAQAACTIVGGHSLDTPEPTYGFAVTGLTEPERLVTNAGARSDDALVLTKPLGTGIISTAIKRGLCPPPLRDRAVEVMTALSDHAARAMVAAGAHAATDVTGFGLLGHLRQMLVASGLAALIDLASVPVIEGTSELLAAGCYPGGSVRNLEAVTPYLTAGAEEGQVRILADAQTSGGLLIALPASEAASLATELKGAVIGRLLAGEAGSLRLA